MTFNKELLCFFDLETTGLDTNKESIIQFGACNYTGKNTFLKYCYPSNNTNNLNTEIHGISYNDLVNNNACSINDILNKFIEWVNNNFKEERVYLIAHNCFNFDLLILEQEFKRQKLCIPEKWIFIDSLLQFKEFNKSIGYGNYSLTKLFNNITNSKLVNAHDALIDSIALSYVYNHLTDFKKDIFNIILNRSYRSVYYLDINLLPIYYINGINYYFNKINNINLLIDMYNNNTLNKFRKKLFKLDIKSKYIQNNIINHINHINHIKNT